MQFSRLQIRWVLLAGVAVAALLTLAYFGTQTYRIKSAPAKLQQAMRAPDWPADDAVAASRAREQIVNPRGIVRLFDLDAEGNIPTLYSSMQLFFASGILLVIANHARAQQRNDAWLWFVLGLGFVYLAIDEGTSLHSSFYIAAASETTRRARGIFYFSWIIPASIGACAVGLFYLRFLWRLPRATRILFLAAGIWYVGSAVGGEMIQGWWSAQGLSKIRFRWVLFTTAEEVGEMLAITLFIAALLDYMRRTSIAIQLSVAGGPDAALVRPRPIPDAAPEAGSSLPVSGSVKVG